MNYLNVLDRPIAQVEAGGYGYRRALVAASSAPSATANLLAAVELGRNDGPWVRPDDFRKVNGLLRYSRGTAQSGFALTALVYDGRVDSTDQVPVRAIESGQISRFGVHRPHGRRPVAPPARCAPRGSAASARRSRGSRATSSTTAWTSSRTSPTSSTTRRTATSSSRRTTAGSPALKASRLWVSGGADRPTELTVGAAAPLRRHLAGGPLPHEARARLATTREDVVRQTSASLYAQADTAWTSVVAHRRSGCAATSTTSTWTRATPPTPAPTPPSPEPQARPGPRPLGPHRALCSTPAAASTATTPAAPRSPETPSTGEPAEPVDPLVRARGAELGLRTLAVPGLHATRGAVGPRLDSELLFVGDAGTTEASRPSQRRGVESRPTTRPAPGSTLDASSPTPAPASPTTTPPATASPAPSRASFAAGVTVTASQPLFGQPARAATSARGRSSRTTACARQSTTLVNADLAFRVRPGWSSRRASSTSSTRRSPTSTTSTRRGCPASRSRVWTTSTPTPPRPGRSGSGSWRRSEGPRTRTTGPALQCTGCAIPSRLSFSHSVVGRSPSSTAAFRRQPPVRASPVSRSDRSKSAIRSSKRGPSPTGGRRDARDSCCSRAAAASIAWRTSCQWRASRSRRAWSRR